MSGQQEFYSGSRRDFVYSSLKRQEGVWVQIRVAPFLASLVLYWLEFFSTTKSKIEITILAKPLRAIEATGSIVRHLRVKGVSSSPTPPSDCSTQRRNPNAPKDKNASSKQMTIVKMIYPLFSKMFVNRAKIETTNPKLTVVSSMILARIFFNPQAVGRDSWAHFSIRNFLVSN